jgi:hypothetical protein
MAIIAIVAINLGAIRLWSVSAGPAAGGGFSRLTNQGLVLGGLPMANLLAVGFLVSRRNFASRPFLLGFEVFGAMALGLYIAIASLFTKELLFPYVHSVILPLGDLFGPPVGQPFSLAQLLIHMSFAVAMLGLPQLTVSLIGGFLFRWFGVAKRLGQTRC